MAKIPSVTHLHSNVVVHTSLNEQFKALNIRDGSLDPAQCDRIQQICNCLVVSDNDLRRLMEELLNEMEKGLSSDTVQKAALKMLPSYVRAVPNGTESGRFLALDLGGTNFRVLMITIKGSESNMVGKIYRVSDSIMKGTGAELFDRIAECLKEFVIENNLSPTEKLPLGFTFSFPCQQDGLTTAKLITWTKGFKASGVENQDVVKLLREAFQRRKGVNIDVMAILNDTVGTLMACAFKENTCQIGVIVGTGSNACYMEKLNRIGKLKNLGLEKDGVSDEMIINMEWGALGDDGTLDFIRTRFDIEVDNNTINRGKQSFEKMMSGMYLGEIVRVILYHLAQENLIFQGNSAVISVYNSFPTKYLSEIEVELQQADKAYIRTMQILEDIGIEHPTLHDCISVGYVCSLVSTRAAYLCAAGIATLLNRIKKPFVTVGLDGSVYRFHPTFPKLLDKKIFELIDQDLEYQLMLSEDGSGRGAALVAAVAARLCKGK